MAAQKETQRLLDKLVNPKSLLFGICLAQILDKYARTSLDAQKLANFPTTIDSSCQKLVSDLKQLSKDWEWQTSKLEMAVIVIPAQLV